MGPAALCYRGSAYFFNLLLMRTVWSRAHNSHFTNKKNMAQRLSNLLMPCLLLVHGSFRFKPRHIWIFIWFCVGIDFLSWTCPCDRGGGWRRTILCSSFIPSCLPSFLLSFPPVCSISTTPIPLHLLEIKLGKQKWNEHCSANPSLEMPTYTGLMLLMMFYWFSL